MKKAISMLLCFAMGSSVFVGCQSKVETQTEVPKSETGAAAESKENIPEEEILVNNTYKTGYPIVEDKITLRAVVEGAGHIGMMQDMEYFKQLEELTNIHIEFEQHQQGAAEKINLMFASRDFPDIIFRGANDRQIMGAAAGGDIIPLNDLMREYAPNWNQVFAEMPLARKLSTMPDGNIYSLPYIQDEDVEKGFRDLWMINVQWLDELSLDIPTTTEEYRQVLRAFKANEGKGSIPQNAIPWYFRFNQYVGGNFDIFGAFGVLVPDANYIIVENGKVQFQAVNPDIKGPIKFMHELYTEGLIPFEAFTDDGATATAKMNSAPPILGVIHGFHNPHETDDIYKAMAPVKGPGVEQPLFRQQTSVINRNYFSIFSGNQYPEASIRLADTLAEKDWSAQAKLGIYGQHIEKTANGGLRALPSDPDNPRGHAVPGNFICAALTRELFVDFQYEGKQAMRQQAFEMYKPYIAPLESFYPNVVYSPDQTDELAIYTTDINGYISETIAHWIVDGKIDEEWDGYVKKLYDMGAERYIQIYQDALDVFNNQ